MLAPPRATDPHPESVDGKDLAWIFALFTLHLLVPGPSMLYICASASRGQRRRALAFVAGTTVGTTTWAGLTMLGAWRLMADAPLLLGGLKLLVGLTLIVLGARAVLAAFAEHGIEAASEPETASGVFSTGNGVRSLFVMPRRC